MKLVQCGPDGADDDDATGCQRSGSTMSSTAGRTSAGMVERRQQFETRLAQRSDDDDEKLRLATKQKMLRRLSEPADRAGTELVPRDDRSSDQRPRRAPSDREREETGLKCSVKNLSQRPGSFMPHDNGRKLWPGGGLFGMWTVSLGPEQIERVELFYAGHATQISVCRCLASLYSTSPTTGIYQYYFIYLNNINVYAMKCE